MTRVFFDTENFADNSTLEQLHLSLNHTCSQTVEDSQLFLGLSPRRSFLARRPHNIQIPTATARAARRPLPRSAPTT